MEKLSKANVYLSNFKIRHFLLRICLLTPGSPIIAQSKTLTGLYPDHPKKQTEKPTALRLLRAFSNLNLTIIEVRSEPFGYVPALNLLQQEIICLLALSPDLYSNLVDNSS